MKLKVLNGVKRTYLKIAFYPMLAAVFIVATLSEITDITPLINACGGRLLMMILEKLIFTQKG